MMVRVKDELIEPKCDEGRTTSSDGGLRERPDPM